MAAEDWTLKTKWHRKCVERKKICERCRVCEQLKRKHWIDSVFSYFLIWLCNDPIIVKTF